MSGIITGGMALFTGFAVAGAFAALSVLHVYWALGGTAGVQAAIPERPSGRGDPANNGGLVKALHPTAATTLLVAGALATVSVLVSLRAGLFGPARSDGSLRWSLAAVALMLLARAVGDLRLVGFFKRIRGTRFAILDSWLYSPLCVVLALGIASLDAAPDQH